MIPPTGDAPVSERESDNQLLRSLAEMYDKYGAEAGGCGCQYCNASVGEFCDTATRLRALASRIETMERDAERLDSNGWLDLKCASCNTPNSVRADWPKPVRCGACGGDLADYATMRTPEQVEAALAVCDMTNSALRRALRVEEKKVKHLTAALDAARASSQQDAEEGR